MHVPPECPFPGNISPSHAFSSPISSLLGTQGPASSPRPESGRSLFRALVELEGKLEAPVAEGPL